MTVIPNRSMPGLIALMEGRAHMAMISASLKSEVGKIKKVMPGLALRPPAGALHCQHANCDCRSIRQIRFARRRSIRSRRSCSARSSNWSELGGKDQPIRVVLVGGGGGVTTVVESELLNGKLPEGPNIIYVKTPRSARSGDRAGARRLGICAACAGETEGACRRSITEAPIEQTLSLVTFGDPTPAMKAVIDAARPRPKRPCDVVRMARGLDKQRVRLCASSAAALRRSSIALPSCLCSPWRRCRSPRSISPGPRKPPRSHLYGDSFLGVLKLDPS